MNTSNFCIVTYCDKKYWPRALITISDIRNGGNYNGDVVLMTNGSFEIDNNIIQKFNLIIKYVDDVDTSYLIEQIRKHPFSNSDGREYTKLQQWNKLHVFNKYFKYWNYILFVDAGLRFFDDINYFTSSLIPNKIVALDDGHPDFTKKFHTQIELSNLKIVDKLKEIYDINSSYFLNCLFIFDTSLIKNDTYDNLIEMMNKYPICKTNEMAIMNIYFRNDWQPLNIWLDNGKILFDWSERNNNTWKNYVSLKYPRT